MLTQVARVKCVQDDVPCTQDLTLWHASVAQVWLGLFEYDGVTPLDVLDLTGFTSATLEVWSDEHNSATLLATSTVAYADFNTGLTLPQWDAKTHATVKFAFTSDQLNLEVKGTFTKYWYVIYLTSPGGRHVVAGGKFILQRNQAGGGGTPPDPPDNFYTKAEVDALLAPLTVNESPYHMVDNENDLQDALLLGKWALLRGEGNGGVIEVTTTKTVDLKGTKVLGYGWHPTEEAAEFAKIKGAFPTPLPYGAESYNTVFLIHADDVEFAGFEIEGLDSPSLTVGSYVPFIVSAEHDLDGICIKDIKARNIHRFVQKGGYNGASITRRLCIERCNVTNVVNFGLYLRESIYDAIIRDNIFECREVGGPTGFVWSQGMHIISDVRNLLLDNNKVIRPERMGIELFSTTYASPVFELMLQNRVTRNTVLDARDMGMSITYSTDTIIAENIIDGAVSIGLESANGHVYLESSNRHQCKLVNNIVRNVTSPSNYVSGISLDGSFGDEVYGNTVENVSSGYTNGNLSQQASYCRGMVLQRARRSKIRLNTFNHVDGVGIFVQPVAGQYQHVDRIVVENNEFFLDEAQTKAYFAMWLQGSKAVVRNNISWVPSAWTGPTPFRGGYLGEFQGTTGIEIGNSASMPAYSGYFRDTNLLLPY